MIKRSIRQIRPVNYLKQFITSQRIKVGNTLVRLGCYQLKRITGEKFLKFGDERLIPLQVNLPQCNASFFKLIQHFGHL